MDKLVSLMKDKLSKLTPTYTFRFVVLLAFMFFILSVLSFMRANKQEISIKEIQDYNLETLTVLKAMNYNIEKMGNNIELQNKNNLAYDESAYIYLRTFQYSMYKIKDKVIITLNQNNVDDEIRQEVIYKTYRVFISNLYVDDYSKLSRFKYEGEPLSNALDLIDNKIVTDELTHILFQEGISHKQKEADVVAYLEYTFREFYQSSIKNLK